MRPRLFPSLVLLAAAASGLAAGPVADPKRAPAPAPSFSRDVRPILAAHCVRCHGGASTKADLDLSSPARVVKGGASGPAVVKGSAADSLLYEQVSSRAMPPGKARKLTAEQVGVIGRWIDAGAPSDVAAGTTTTAASMHWAFRPPVKPPVPDAGGAARVRTPVDSFLLAALESRGLDFSPEADRPALIRRATFDLTGLPPTPEELDRFLADGAPGAFERLVDRLLASPAYGERWGRHWLDAAGYSDTQNLDNDLGIVQPNENIWKFRDYVVRSYNLDTPFDRFLTEQLAGDELVDWRSAPRYDPGTLDALTATGFLRNVPDDTNAPELNRPLERNLIVGRVAESVGSNLLGLTVGCARCHNHKYDPVTQEDYYRLVACFTPAYDPGRWKTPAERTMPDVPPGEVKDVTAHNAEVDRTLAELKSGIEALRKAAERRVREARLAAIPEAIRSDLRAALATPEKSRAEVQKYLVAMLGPLVSVKPADVEAALTAPERGERKALANRSAALASRKRSHGAIQAVWEDGQPPTPTRVLRRGDWATPLATVAPGFVAALCPTGPVELSRPADAKGPSSGRRLALARWLTRPDHPLTARVLVNRLWQHHFGVGIVATSDNLGVKGAAPTNQALLDWLAVDFVEHGWSLKRLHRLVMTSAAYRQSSRRPAPDGPAGSGSRAEAADPGNDGLWRMPLRRLDAESVRDAMLAVSGGLDRRMGGKPTPLLSRPDGLILPDPSKPADALLRSLYLFARRNYPVGILEAFDFPIMALNCTRRTTTATPLQSLTALNSDFAQGAAEAFAARVVAETGTAAPTEARVEHAFLLAFARRPRPEEARRCVEFLAADGALGSLCHMLFCSNEFLYVE
jgi:hypothetical protein